MKTILSIFIFLLSQNSTAQTTIATTLKLYKKVPIVATDFNVDQVGNIYAVSPTKQLKKINEKGDSLAVYNLNKRYGKLTYIDVTNPLKVILYYKDYSTAVIVDRLLNITNIIDLRKQNIYQVNAVTTSYDGQFWFYDEQEAKLKKINDKGKITQQSVDMRQVLNYMPSPLTIKENNLTVYLYDTKKGVVAFDYYGALKYQLLLVGWSNFYAFNNYLYGVSNGSIVQYNILTAATITTTLPVELANSKMIVAANKIYFLLANEIQIYYNQE